MMRACTDRHIATVSSTNGNCLQSVEQAEAVVASGLSALIIAIDGSTQEIYEDYRHGGSLEKDLRCAIGRGARVYPLSLSFFVNLPLLGMAVSWDVNLTWSVHKSGSAWEKCHSAQFGTVRQRDVCKATCIRVSYSNSVHNVPNQDRIHDSCVLSGKLLK